MSGTDAKDVGENGAPGTGTSGGDSRPEGLLRWQWSHYEGGHRDRTNLFLHAISAPLFVLGSIACALAPFVSAWLALGALVMVAAIVVQGVGHKRERTPPIPFRGPLDVVARLVVEQWVTFPRFVATGGFRRALSPTSEASDTSDEM